MSLGMVPDKVGGGSRASNEPWATSLEQGTQVSMATLRAATTHKTRTIREFPKVISGRMNPWPPLTSIALILT